MDIAFQEYLNNAIMVAQGNVPKRMNLFNGMGYIDYPSNKFFSQVSDSFVKNDVLTENASPLTHASAFALRVLNSIDATRRIQRSIALLFDHPETQRLFAKEGISTDEEKQQLREDLKKHVEEQLSVKAKSEEGMEFVEQMKAAYDQFAKKSQAEKFLEVGCSFLYGINKQIINNKYEDTIEGNYNEDAIESNYDEDTIRNNDIDAINKITQFWDNHCNKYVKNSRIVMDTMYRALAENTQNLAKEISGDLNTEIVQNYDIYFGGSVDVKPFDFLEHAKTGEFTPAEKIWAQDIYRNLVQNQKFDSVEMDEFTVNGKPMFSKEQLQNTSKEDLSCKLVEKMLKGEDVAIQTKNQEPVHIDVNLIKKERSGFFQKLFGFISDLLHRSARQKEETLMQQLTQDLEEKQNQNKANRQKVSFNDLSGKDSVSKITTHSPKDKQHSSEQKKDIGMSSGK